MTLSAQLFKRIDREGDIHSRFELSDKIEHWSLLPESSARPLPEYVPEPLRADYTQACRIRDLSPKASATLARRCLQGMIRDFCGIAKNRLLDEINELKKRVASGTAPAGVQADTIDAIDHVRSIGNIGAHMEQDINVIVDVDPDEAQQMIGLLELLFDEWYIGRHQRAERLKAIGAIASSKAVAKKVSPATTPKATP
jgi:hypothetical protein